MCASPSAPPPSRATPMVGLRLDGVLLGALGLESPAGPETAPELGWSCAIERERNRNKHPNSRQPRDITGSVATGFSRTQGAGEDQCRPGYRRAQGAGISLWRGG